MFRCSFLSLTEFRGQVRESIHTTKKRVQSQLTLIDPPNYWAHPFIPIPAAAAGKEGQVVRIIHLYHRHRHHLMEQPITQTDPAKMPLLSLLLIQAQII